MYSAPILLDYARPLPLLRRPRIQAGIIALSILVAAGIYFARPKPRPAPMMPLKLDLPRPMFVSTPRALPSVQRYPNLNRTCAARPPFMVPVGTTLLSRNKPVAISDIAPIIGDASLITDGIKDGENGNWVELAPGPQCAQIDLQQRARIYAVVIWHCANWPWGIPNDVIVQISDDPDFKTNVITVFNNDHDNSSGLGAGTDQTYIEGVEGVLADGKGTAGRYVRVWSNGNSEDAFNRFTEIEVHGIPVTSPVSKAMRALGAAAGAFTGCK